MKQSSRIAFVLLLFLCACTQNTVPTPTITANVKEHLIQQLVKSFLEWSAPEFPSALLLGENVSEYEKYLAAQFLNLLSNPDTQTLNFADLQEVFQTAVAQYREPTRVIFYEGSDSNYVLANFGYPYSGMGHSYNIPTIYVFSRIGEAWHFGSGVIGKVAATPYPEWPSIGRVNTSTIEDVRTVDNGWVFAVDFRTSGSPDGINFGVWHLMQIDNEWHQEELIHVNWDTVSVSAPSQPILEFDNNNHRLRVSYIGYTDTLPCQFNDQIAKSSNHITPYYEYLIVFEWQNGTYVQVDQWEEAIFLSVLNLDDYSRSRIDNWQDYCED